MFFKQNRLINIFLGSFGFLIIILLSSGNYFRADISSYINAFYNPDISYFEPGYKVLANFFSSWSNNFNTFQLFYFSICYSLLFIFYIRLKMSFTWFLFYVIYPFSFDVIQMRFFAGTCFLLHSLLFFHEKKLIMSLFFLILATFFHKSLLVFLPIFIAFKYLKDKQKIILILFPIWLIVIYVLHQYLNVFVALASQLGESINYASGNKILGGWGHVAIISANIFFNLIICYILKKRHNFGFLNFYITVNLMFLFLVPSYFLDNEFERFFRILFILYYAFYQKIAHLFSISFYFLILSLALILWLIFLFPGEASFLSKMKIWSIFYSNNAFINSLFDLIGFSI